MKKRSVKKGITVSSRADQGSGREMLRNLVQGASYTNFDLLAKSSEIAKLGLKKSTLKRYLTAEQVSGKIFDAGRGWYSRLPEPAILDPRPLEPLIKDLKSQFPLLDFSCWALEQLNAFAHHLFGKQVFFLSVDEAGLDAVAEYLDEQGYTVHVKPGKPDAKKVALKDKTVILRSALKLPNSPFKGPLAPVEKVVVDLYFEIEKLGLIDRSEYQAILRNLFENKRISVSELFSYIKQREKTVPEVLGASKSFFSGFSKNPEKPD